MILAAMAIQPKSLQSNGQPYLKLESPPLVGQKYVLKKLDLHCMGLQKQRDEKNRLEFRV